VATAFWNRINTILLLLVLLVVIGGLASRAWGGPLDPTGPPASTLPQVEPRSPIPPVGWDGVSAISVNSSGSYFLTRNLNVPITIAVENVTFDLSGFTLTGGGNQTAIIMAAGTKRHIVIRNGTLIGPGTSGGSAVFAPEAGRSTFSDLEISGWGVGLQLGTGNTVLRVNSHNNTGPGIQVTQGTDFGGSIEDSNFSHNGGYGIVLFGNNVEVRDSVMDTNVSSGIAMLGSWNAVNGSRMVGNFYGAETEGNRNVVVMNHIDGNTTGSVFNSGAGNIIGPISPATGTNPAENIGF
jgi:hypothetical protein